MSKLNRTIPALSVLVAVLSISAVVGVVRAGGRATSAQAVVVPSPEGDSASLALPSSYSPAAMAQRVAIEADRPAWAGRLRPVGPASASTPMTVTLTLQGRDPRAEAAYAADEYRANSPSFHSFLTPAQFDQRFGAEAARTAAARSWLAGGGLSVAFQSGAGTLLQATGTEGQVARLFGVRFSVFQSQGHRFLAALDAPRVPAVLGVTAVGGLDTFPYFHHFDLRLDQPRTAATSSFPVSASTDPPDLWSIYDQPANDRGAGQHLASFSEGFGPDTTGPLTMRTIVSDLRAYEANPTGSGAPNHLTLPQIPFQAVYAGVTSTDTSGIDEWDLDLQAASSMAPDAAGYTMYFADSLADEYVAIQDWADDPNGALQASASYGGCEEVDAITGDMVSTDSAAEQAVVEGRTLFVSTGDAGAGCGVAINTATNSPLISVEYPAASPWVVAVGGTVITDKAGPGDRTERDVEYSWVSSGGGLSHNEPAPPWQAAELPPPPRGSGVVPATPPCTFDRLSGLPTLAVTGSVQKSTAPCRAIPDVAAQSGDQFSGYDIIVQGQQATVLGTSLSAPLWQGMWARVQAASPLVRGVAAGLGFAAPSLYGQYANAKAYARDFFDITIGNNGPYPDTTGWDYVSGLGVPDVTGLARSLDPANPSLAPTDPGATRAPTAAVPGTTVCRGAPQLTAANAGGGTAQSTAPADLDITSASFSSDPTGSTLAVTIKVAKMAAQPQTGAPGSLGDLFEAEFNLGPTQYAIYGARETVDDNIPPDPPSGVPYGTRFELAAGNGQPPSVFAGAIDAAPLTSRANRFDVAHSQVTLVLTNGDLAAVQRKAGAPVVPLNGQLLTRLEANSQYDDGPQTVPADELSTGCAFLMAGRATASASGTVASTSLTCHGPLWTQAPGTDDYPTDAIPENTGSPSPVAGPLAGQNPQLALTEGDMAMAPDGRTLRAALRLAGRPTAKNIPPGGSAVVYYDQWTFGGVEYFAAMEIEASGAVSYFDGYVGNASSGSPGVNTVNHDHGSMKPLAGGGTLVEIDEPLTHIVSPTGSGSAMTAPPGAGAVLSSPNARSDVLVSAPSALLSGGPGLLVDGDTGGPNWDYTVGADCGL
ncbi:MAG TPA: S53 family peptidase [Acidimicrobiales bacterium]|nr:S53 family peptidase [Acidimicrobiales bacterium]